MLSHLGTWLAQLHHSLVPVVKAADSIDAAGTAKNTSIKLSDYFTLGNSNVKVADIYDQPADLVNLIVPIMMIVGGIIFFILLLYGGFKFIQDSEKGPDEAAQVWTIAFSGLVVMFVAYWLVFLIAKITGADIVGFEIG